MEELQYKEFNKGDILVTSNTNPDWEPIMVKSGGIITNCGGRTSHAAIIMREFGIIGIVGTGNATEILNDDHVVTISCCEGETGFVYDGIIAYEKINFNLDELPKIKTQLMFNVASPTDVFKYASYPAKGVGLVREEFIINNYIRVHPMALVNYNKLKYEIKDEVLIETIDKLSIGYDTPIDFYIDKLMHGLARIAATFYPHNVVVRFSDFKTNEYRNLLGGHYYEPEEENPMIGFRGASRYYSSRFKDAFGLECIAIKKLRDKLGLTNVIVMIPFCRTVEECIQVLDIMKEFGLERGINGLQVYIMCEVPSNVILA